MSISASRQLLSRLLSRDGKKCFRYLAAVRFKADEASKREDSPDDSGKIEAAVLKKFSEPLHIEAVDPPKRLQSTEVLIDVNYCALNGLDVLLCENLYSHEPSLPFVPGYEVAGKLIEVSEGAKKAGYRVGDKVVALNKERYGGLAERCIAEVNDVWKIPASIKSIDAVCLMENYMTALIGLEGYGSISEEDMILINVGIGGIGLAAVDIAANVFRAKVIGVGFSEDRADKIRERGAYHAFTYNEKKLIKEIEEIAKERDIEDIFEGDSGAHFKKVLNAFMNVYKSRTPSKHLLRDNNFGVVVQHLSREDKIIIAGVAHSKPGTDGMKEDKDEKKEKKNKEKEEDFFTVTGIDLRDYKKRKNDVYRQTGDEVISFLEEGLIKPAPCMIAGFYEVNAALKYISEMKACGKVLIDMKNKEAEAKIQ